MPIAGRALHKVNSKAIADFDIKDPRVVLYLPLWYPDSETTGNTIISKDIYRRSCTVTGATWGTQGRTFNGDDYIEHSEANFRSGDSSGSILVWFKTSLTYFQTLVASCDEGTTIDYIHILGIDSAGKLRVRNSGTNTSIVSGDTDVTDDVWHLGSLVSNGTAWSIYVDDKGAEELTVGGDGNTGDWFADVAHRDNLTIGVRHTSSPFFRYFTGTIGEVLIYSRTLSAAEITRIYNATKWRY